MRKVQKNKKMRALIKSHDKLVDPMLKMKLEVFENVKSKLMPHAEAYVDMKDRKRYASFVLLLRDDFNFGAKRIAKTLERLMYHYDFLDNDTITADEVFEEVKRETGFDFDKMLVERAEETKNA